jgi:hypothetical protein
MGHHVQAAEVGVLQLDGGCEHLFQERLDAGPGGDT